MQVFFGGEMRSGANAASEIADLACSKLSLGSVAKPLSSLSSNIRDLSSDKLLLFIIESDSDGGCMEVRKFLRVLKKAQPMAGFAFCTLALARSACSFSAASLGAEKYKVGRKVSKSLAERNGREVIEMGTAEVELEDINESIVPWIAKCGDYVKEIKSTTSSSSNSSASCCDIEGGDDDSGDGNGNGFRMAASCELVRSWASCKHLAKFCRQHLPSSLHVLGILLDPEQRVNGDKIRDQIYVDDIQTPSVLLIKHQQHAPADRVEFTAFSADDEKVEQVLRAAVLEQCARPPELDWMFSSLARRLLPILERVLQSHGYCISWREPCVLFVLDIEPVWSGTESGKPHTLVELGEGDASFVNRHWTYGTAASLPKVRCMLQQMPSSAVSIDGELVAWILTYTYGAVGMLHTLESERGNGYASAVTAELCRRLQHQGRVCFAYIVESNEASRKVFARLGFREVEAEDWVGCAPNAKGGAGGDNRNAAPPQPQQRRLAAALRRRLLRLADRG
jgi:hypothetical protein